MFTHRCDNACVYAGVNNNILTKKRKEYKFSLFLNFCLTSFFLLTLSRVFSYALWHTVFYACNLPLLPTRISFTQLNVNMCSNLCLYDSLRQVDILEVLHVKI